MEYETNCVEDVTLQSCASWNCLIKVARLPVLLICLTYWKYTAGINLPMSHYITQHYSPFLGLSATQVDCDRFGEIQTSRSFFFHYSRKIIAAAGLYSSPDKALWR